MSNAVLEHIYQVIGNLVRTFNISQTHVETNEPWMGILAAEACVMIWTINRIKGYIPGQLLFGRYMILLIKNEMDWELIHQRKQVQINNDNIRKNKHRVDHNYKVG